MCCPDACGGFLLRLIEEAKSVRVAEIDIQIKPTKIQRVACRIGQAALDSAD